VLIVGNYHFVSDVIADYFRSGLRLGVAGPMLSQNDPVASGGRPDRIRLRASDLGADSPTPVEAESRTAHGLIHAVFNVRVSGQSYGFRLDEDDRSGRPRERPLRTAGSSDGGGSSRPTSHDPAYLNFRAPATITTADDGQRDRLSLRSKRTSTLNTARPRSGLPGKASTDEVVAGGATAPPNCSTTARSRSKSPPWRRGGPQAKQDTSSTAC